MLIRLIDAFLITNNRNLGGFKKLIQFWNGIAVEKSGQVSKSYPG
jgi:hypothetical protein